MPLYAAPFRHAMLTAIVFPAEPGLIAIEFTSENPYGEGANPAFGASSTSVKPVPAAEPLKSPALEATKTLPCPSNLMSPIVWLSKAEPPSFCQLDPPSDER